MSDNPDKRNADNPILEALRQSIRRALHFNTDAMANGSCADYAEYRYLAGVIYGLAIAERELLDLDNTLLRE